MIKVITNQTSIDYPYELATIEECIGYCSKQVVLGLDIETTRKYNKWLDFEGLDPHTSDIVMLQIGTEEVQYIIDTRYVDITSLLPILTNPKIQIVGHNLKFEYKHILKKYGVRINNLYDTMIAEKLIENGYKMPMGLKDLIQRYLKREVDKSFQVSFLIIKDRPFSSEQILYGAEDIELPLIIRRKQLDRLVKHDLLNCARLEFRFTAVLAEMEYTGINFNSNKWLLTYAKNLEKYKAIIKELDDYILKHYQDTKFVNKQYDLFSDGFTCNIKWSSSKQVIQFFRHLNCCPQATSKTTKKLEYTVEAKEVEALLVKSKLPNKVKEFVKLYLKAKEYEQAVTTFGHKFLKYVNPITKRVHSNYNQIVNTGRMSSRSPNNQNIPAHHDFRYAFDNPPGTVIVNADYSGQENYVLANKCLDPDILAFYDEGLSDMHSYIASKLFPEDLNGMSLPEIKEKRPDLRQIAKAAGFALAYGGVGFTIAKNLGIDESIGNKVYEDYFEAFPGLKQYFADVKEDALKKGYILIDDVTKRKFFLKDMKYIQRMEYRRDYRGAEKLKDKIGRLAQNYPIQGTSGSMTKYAAILLYDWILANNLQDEIKIVLLVHDEINLEVREAYAEQAARKLEECMEEAGLVWCKRVPLKASAVVSTYWQH